MPSQRPSLSGETLAPKPVLPAVLSVIFLSLTSGAAATEHLGVSADDFAHESAIDRPADDGAPTRRQGVTGTTPSAARNGVGVESAGTATGASSDAPPVEIDSPARKRAGDRPPPVDPMAGARAGEPDVVTVTGERAFDHESAFEGYRPYEEADGPGWIESNRRVGEIGGWRTYAREIYEAQRAASEEQGR